MKLLLHVCMRSEKKANITNPKIGVQCLIKIKPHELILEGNSEHALRTCEKAGFKKILIKIMRRL